MRSLSKVLLTLSCALASAGMTAGVGSAGGLVPAELSRLAARAEKRGSWPRLRRYAETHKDPEPRGCALLVLGYREYEAEDFAAAAGDLQQAAETGFSLADFANYYRAEAALRAGDPAQAARSLENFSSRFAESVLRYDALEFQAEAWLKAQEPQRALEALLAEPLVRQRPPLALMLARAYLDAQRLQDAARAFQEIYFAFPTASEADAAGEALEGLRFKLGADFPESAEEIQTARADNLFRASQAEEALQEYDKLLAARPASRFVERWRLGRARCLLRLQRTEEAFQALSSSFAGNPAMEAERLALLARIQAQQEDLPAMLAALSQLQSLNPQSTAYAVALFAAGNFYFQQGDWPNAAHYYQLLLNSFAQGEHARDAGWRLAWSYYMSKESDRARQAFSDYITHFSESPHVAVALYWLGRLQEERGERAEARALYATLHQRYVHSFYALQAERRMQELPSKEAAEESDEVSPASPLAAVVESIPPAVLPAISPCASRPEGEAVRPAEVLEALSLDKLEEQYLKAALAEYPDSPILRWFSSQLAAQQQDVSAALFEAVKAAPAYSQVEFAALPRELWNLLFPRAYWKLVEHHARANRLDPYLIMGLIRQESGFDPRATSRADARGLMQILPETASRSQRASRIRATGERLYNPAYNVRFGCAHLRKLLKQFDGDLERALAAYNAGDFRVKGWPSRFACKEPGEFLESIPISVTHTYVEAVLRDAGIYRQLLAGSAKFADCRPASTPARKGRPAGTKL